MKDLKSLVKKYWYSAAILLLFLIAVFLRVYRLESLPDVLHIDEAGLGYNAWCLAHYGTDRYLISMYALFTLRIFMVVRVLFIPTYWLC